MKERGWCHFEHVADVGVRGWGPDLATAFEQAALALMAIAVDLDTVDPREAVGIVCEAPEPDILLVDWLNALIGEASRRGMVFARFAVALRDGRLTGQAYGEPVDRRRHRLGTELKGATYTALRVVHDAAADRWTAQCVVDV